MKLELGRGQKRQAHWTACEAVLAGSRDGHVALTDDGQYGVVCVMERISALHSMSLNASVDHMLDTVEANTSTIFPARNHRHSHASESATQIVGWDRPTRLPQSIFVFNVQGHLKHNRIIALPAVHYRHSCADYNHRSITSIPDTETTRPTQDPDKRTTSPQSWMRRSLKRHSPP